MSDSHKPSAVVEANPVVERRRPGRIASASPALIPLLRGSIVPAAKSEEPQERGVPPARGLYSASSSLGCFGPS